MAKPRRKRNSNRARDHKLFGTCHLFTWEGLLSPKDGCQYTTAQTYLRMGGWCPMGEDLASHLVNYPRNWMIGVRALCRAPDGAMWMESQTFDLAARKIGDIDGAYHQLRADVLSAQRTDQVFDMGWIAQTWSGRKPDDERELWHYYYAPPEIIAQVCSDRRTIERMAGPGYSESRKATWQQSDIDYLADRAEENARQARLKDELEYLDYLSYEPGASMEEFDAQALVLDREFGCVPQNLKSIREGKNNEWKQRI